MKMNTDNTIQSPAPDTVEVNLRSDGGPGADTRLILKSWQTKFPGKAPIHSIRVTVDNGTTGASCYVELDQFWRAVTAVVPHWYMKGRLDRA